MTGHLLFLLLLCVVEVLGTVGGFGSSMLVMPLAGWFLPFEEALGLTALFHVFSNVAKIVLFRDGVAWRLLLWLGIPAVIAVVIGAWLTAFVNERYLGAVLGASLVLMGTGLLWKHEWQLRATNANAMTGGAISGFIAGLAGTGGAVRGVTLAAFGLEKMSFVSTSAWIDLGVDSSRSAVYASQGFMTTEVLTYLPVMAIASITGSWLGRWILRRTSQGVFRAVVLALVVAMGAVTLARAIIG